MKVIASHNGLKAASRAYELLKTGTAALDACVEGVTLVEDDPEELTVGFGGLPNEDGVVELDAAVMDGKTHRGGAVSALRGIRHPTQVARLIMQQTRRVMLTGEGAFRFAQANGFPEEDLLTEKARRMWLYWKRRRSEIDDWITPDEQQDLDLRTWFDRHFYACTGTVHCAAIDARGDLACATSTSGHAFKIAGRVGDSPILGAGLFVDNEVGTCGSIGNGEANMEHLSSFAAVERMRSGTSPAEAGLEILRRIANKTASDLKDGRGAPDFDLQLYAMTCDGQHAGVAMRGSKRIAVCDEDGPRLEPCTPLFPSA